MALSFSADRVSQRMLTLGVLQVRLIGTVVHSQPLRSQQVYHCPRATHKSEEP